MKAGSDRKATRERIVKAAAVIIRNHGTEAATTRAVADAANVQAPTIYRLIGDKKALLDAVAEHELAAYVAAKRKNSPMSDPVEALRCGWDEYAAFGFANPALFLIMSNNSHSPAASAGLKVLATRIHAIALAGRLRGSEERAAAMIHAACAGTVLTLLADEEKTTEERNSLSAEMREAMIAAVINLSVSPEIAGLESAAATLRARLSSQSSDLTKGERGLLDELLQRLSEKSRI